MGIRGPSWATNGYSTPGPERKLTNPLSTTINGVAVGGGGMVGVGGGGKVGVGSSVTAPPGATGVNSVPGSGVAFCGIGVAVGIKSLGFMPGAITMTPGVPFWGGVMAICGKMVSGVGVKVGANARVGAGVGTTRCAKPAAEHPKLRASNTTHAGQGICGFPLKRVHFPMLLCTVRAQQPFHL